MKLPHTEVKFYPEVKSQTGLSSLRVSGKRALRSHVVNVVAVVMTQWYLKKHYKMAFHCEDSSADVLMQINTN